MTTETTTPNQPIRVMLVDDQHLLRMGFRLILEGEDDLQIVAEASDGIEAVETMETFGDEVPDVVLMDVRMPRMDGIAATEKIVERWCHTKVIILTTFDLDEYAFSGLQAGASAFLLKDVEPEALVDAVRVVASGDAVVAPRITQRLLEVYLRNGEALPPGPAGAGVAGAGPDAQQDSAPGADLGNRQDRSQGRSAEAQEQTGASSADQQAGAGAQAVAGSQTAAGPSTVTGAHIAGALEDGVVREPLTAREAEVLFAVAEGLSNTEIAGRFFLSEATVKTHVRRILTKLQLRDRVQAVVYVYQAGLAG